MDVDYFAEARSMSVIAMCGLLAACASAPAAAPPELTVAESTLSDAERAGAVQYAPVELNRAREKLALAQRAIGDGRSQDAQRLAAEAKADAKLAAVKAQASQAEQAVSALRQGENALRNETPLTGSAVPSSTATRPR